MNEKSANSTDMINEVISTILSAGKYLLLAKPKKLTSNKDFLTDTDCYSETIIQSILKRKFPEASFFGEEGGGEISRNGYFFIIDPIDGSFNYYHGDHHWGISIAVILDSIPIIGVVYLPAKQQIFFSQRFDSAKFALVKEHQITNSKKTSVKNQSNPFVLMEWVKEKSGGYDHDRVIEILARLDRAGFLYPQIRNATTASLMMIAQGIASGFVHLRPEPFDIAAACLIVEQSGGRVTDLQGNAWSPFTAEKGIVASNGTIHDSLLSVVNY